jgi:hypothetical protein
MDTEIYSEAVINRFMKRNLFFNDLVLAKYYETNNLAAFRKRVHKLHKDKSFEVIIYAIVTDSIRDVILNTAGELSEFLKNMGDLIISGGEAFNMYLNRNDRLITSDIDTKFIPRIKYDDKYFGKLQAIKLLLWNKLGEIAKRLNMKIKERVVEASRTKMGRFVGMGFAETGPYVTRRYILIKKKKAHRGGEPSKGDIFIDVELFALDLNMRYFSIEKGRIIQEVLGGILDIPFMRPKEFGSEVIESKKLGITYKNKDTGVIVHDKRIYVAGKRFLLDDVYLMQKLGLRPAKKEKDRQRMYKLSKMLTKSANILPTDDINTIYEHTYNQIKTPNKRSSRKPTIVSLRLAAKVNPFSYGEYTTKPREDRVSKQLVYGVKTSIPNMNIPGYAKTYGNQRFNLNKQEWVKNASRTYVKNEFTHRPLTGKNIPASIDTSRLLYGYNPIRDKWVPRVIIKKASQIPFVGLKN